MKIFRTPSRVMTPTTHSSDPDSTKKPWVFFKLEIPQGINVYLYTDNTISETPPPRWEPYTNVDGSVTPGVKKVWLGGHDNPVDADEEHFLTAAGYGAYITPT